MTSKGIIVNVTYFSIISYAKSLQVKGYEYRYISLQMEGRPYTKLPTTQSKRITKDNKFVSNFKDFGMDFQSGGRLMCDILHKYQ